VLLVLLSPQRQLLGAGARPVHPILGPSDICMFRLLLGAKRNLTR
jgi:hypothetical protein